MLLVLFFAVDIKKLMELRIISSILPALFLLADSLTLPHRAVVNATNFSEPVWCTGSDRIDANIMDMKKTMKSDLIRIHKYSKDLLVGNDLVDGFEIAGLRGMIDCHPFVLPTYPKTNFSSNSQSIANKFWRFQLLRLMYKEIFKLIKICHQSSTPEEVISKLTTFQAMIDHYVIHTEDYLSAEQCSCAHVECLIHKVTNAAMSDVMDTVRMRNRPPKCSQMSLLGQVITVIYRESNRTLYYDQSISSIQSSNYKVCHVFSSDRFPDGCPAL